MTVKTHDSVKTKKFATPDDIQRVLCAHNEAALLEGREPQILQILVLFMVLFMQV